MRFAGAAAAAVLVLPAAAGPVRADDAAHIGLPGAAPGSVDPASDRVLIIARAHDRGVKVYGATLTPFAGAGRNCHSASRERARGAVDAWVRGGGEFDGTLDFDAVARDPSDLRALPPAFDAGDHLHPNDAGYRALGDSIPPPLFR